MKKVLLGSAVLLVAGAVAAGVYFWQLDQRITRFASEPFGSADSKTVEIPPGTGPKGVSSLLAQQGVVADADSLYAYLRREKLGPKLKAGEYEFTGAMAPADVIQRLIAGQVKLYRFTVREGLRVDETLSILAASELQLDLAKLQQLANTPQFARKLGIPADSLEGFLYPDTYSFTRGASEEAVLTKMVGRAIEEHRRALGQAKPGVELDLLQAMTLASIVEKETGAPEERPRISCVFHNRLRLKMKLQTDPTVLYAMMLIRGSFIKNITRKDLETDHPYNTYTRKGLPPGPIASAGAAAIQAALNPLECSDLFFVSKNDGTHVFCPDLTCHNHAVQRWQVEFFRKKKGSRG